MSCRFSKLEAEIRVQAARPIAASFSGVSPDSARSLSPARSRHRARVCLDCPWCALLFEGERAHTLKVRLLCWSMNLKLGKFATRAFLRASSFVSWPFLAVVLSVGVRWPLGSPQGGVGPMLRAQQEAGSYPRFVFC